MDGTRIIGVTGASGYVGGIVVQALHRSGVQVRELRRDPESAAAQDGQVATFALGDPPAPQALAGLDGLVHCAWDFAASSPDAVDRINVLGSLKLLGAAHAAGVKRLVFISTMSSFPGCRSLYGKAKLKVEERARGLGVEIVRPGLVYGSRAGGMVGALTKVASLPVIPLVGTGSQVLYLVHEDDLGQVVVGFCAGKLTTGSVPLIAAHPEGWTPKAILWLLAEARGRRPVLVPVPWQCEWLGLRMLELMGLKLRVRSDSLISLINQDRSPDFSVGERMGVTFRKFSLDSLGAAH